MKPELTLTGLRRRKESRRALKNFVGSQKVLNVLEDGRIDDRADLS